MASVEALTKIFTQSIQVVRPDILVQKCIARHGDMIFFGLFLTYNLIDVKKLNCCLFKHFKV